MCAALTGRAAAAFELGLLWLAFPSASHAGPLQPLLTVKEGFSVERVYAVPRETQGSWVSLAADRDGNLYAGDQYGPLYVIQLSAAAGGDVAVKAVPLPIGGVHGLTWVGSDLYAVVGQREVCQPGLYRLRDTDGNGELDHLELLRPLSGDGEHGPHAVAAAPDGKSLYVIAGNATTLPELARSYVPKRWRDDSLLPPLAALMGSETRGLPHGGWICRTDRDGREWELMCMGMRNAYSLACGPSAELFTFDSDTEFEIGLPWYRPTRVLHCVSGADFGWRSGALKIPAGAPDMFPPLIPLGLGSPTAVLFGMGTAFPARYRDALFVADWCYGRLRAVHLLPKGAGFAGESEEIVTGIPLPIAAACINPHDGALYFVTGGRKTHSAIYRLSWSGFLPKAEDPSGAPLDQANESRRRLESFHGRLDPRAIDAAWPCLGSDDVGLRHAARIAIESQPVEDWSDRALSERQPRAALTALLALARAGDASLQPRLLAALESMNWDQLGPLRAEWLRVSALAFCRGGGAAPEVKQRWAKLLTHRFPNGDRQLDERLCELLVYLEDSDIAAKVVSQLRETNTREEQLQYVRYLSMLRTGWTSALRAEYFDWLGRASAWRGGASFAPFLQRIRVDALAATPMAERPEWENKLAAAALSASAPVIQLPTGRGLVKEWKLDELVSLVELAGSRGDAKRGRQWFSAAGCSACHTFAGEGGGAGMDLTAVSRRLSTHELLEAIVDPSKEVSDQYAGTVIRRHDGRQVQGRVVNFTPGVIQVVENLLNPSSITKVPEEEIESITRSKTSLMPAGMLNVLTADEILDLIAYLRMGMN